MQSSSFSLFRFQPLPSTMPSALRLRLTESSGRMGDEPSGPDLNKIEAEG
jgi:hypothetical protein